MVHIGSEGSNFLEKPTVLQILSDETLGIIGSLWSRASLFTLWDDEKTLWTEH
jgi:hypothetical protein